MSGFPGGSPQCSLSFSASPERTLSRLWIACEELPLLKSSISPAIDLSVVLDRTTTVRASVADIEITLIISVILVILVVFAFLRTFRATIIPRWQFRSR